MATLIFKNLSHRKGRTILTLVGIAIGVATIVALGAVGGLHPPGARRICVRLRRFAMNDKVTR